MTDPKHIMELFTEYLAVDIQKVALDLHPDAVALAELLDKLYKVKTMLSDAAQAVEDLLVDAMPSKTLEVEGIGMLTVRAGAKRSKWDHDSLITKVGERIGEQLVLEEGPIVWADTGEQVDTKPLMIEALRQFRQVATPSWKVTGLRPLGIDPDEYCETSWGRKTIEWPKAADHG